ncbi:Queuine tRNA-ribosyltransferase [Thelohanellus kitauei]|uniref:Queuine tRNA-ribosyltransferase n=1 Tax=Thelohanellus kitauei TaxID=669202 RepID=A0A0C2N2F1_THEKT|nr:Queuine tRNA-ribosyltransferase [Thelohanellus kitauei]
MTERNVPGFAIGGLSGGEEKAKFCKVVDFCTDKLPPNKPRYLMGVGYTLDLVVCTALGCDMYDCVFPTRTARFGSALTYYGSLDLKNAQYLIDIDPIDRKCVCYACQNYTRSHIHHLLMSNCTVGAQLVTIHNLYFQKHLMSSMRNAILGDTFDVWVKEFIRNYTQTSKVPEWVENALKTVNIVLD